MALALSDFHALNINAIIEELLSLDATSNTKLNELELTKICRMSRNAFMQQPMLLELNGPIKICGDIHGQLEDLQFIFQKFGSPDDTSYLFLGDYVDRGMRSIECICLLLAYKIKHPQTFHLLRGNHECSYVNVEYGFLEECSRRYRQQVWSLFNRCFDCMPVAAIVNKEIFCCHGGISPELHSMDRIRRIRRPLAVPNEGIVCDLLWSDPRDDLRTWAASQRGYGMQFGEMVLGRFLRDHNLKLVCRAHEYAKYGWWTFGDHKLISIFSASSYWGKFNNWGAVLTVSDIEGLCILDSWSPFSEQQMSSSPFKLKKRNMSLQAASFESFPDESSTHQN